MDDLKAHSGAYKGEATPAVISPKEMGWRRRAEQVDAAKANNRIEGIPTSRAVQEICDAYIRGEIEVDYLVEAYLKRPPQLQL